MNLTNDWKALKSSKKSFLPLQMLYFLPDRSGLNAKQRLARYISRDSQVALEIAGLRQKMRIENVIRRWAFL